MLEGAWGAFAAQTARSTFGHTRDYFYIMTKNKQASSIRKGSNFSASAVLSASVGFNSDVLSGSVVLAPGFSELVIGKEKKWVCLEIELPFDI